jgi:hypothetical protein
MYIRVMAHNKPILSDKSMSSCLLQKAQKPRQHTFAPDQGRYVPTLGVSAMTARNLLAPLLLGIVLLQGCSAVQSIDNMLEERRLAQEQARLDSARRSCSNYGFTAGTDSFAQCMQTEVNKIKDREAIAAAAESTREAIEDAADESSTTTCRTNAIGTTSCTTR